MIFWLRYFAALLSRLIILIGLLAPLVLPAQDGAVLLATPLCRDLLAVPLNKLQKVPIPFTWSNFNQTWKATIENRILKVDGAKPPTISGYKLAVLNQDIRIKSFERFGFDFSKIENDVVIVPELPDVVKVFHAQVDAEFERRSLSKKKKMVPGVVVHDAKGNLFALPYGVEMEGAFHVDVSGQPHLFTQLLRAGIFPITTRRALHDFYHLKGMAEDVDYMVGIYDLALDFGKRGHAIELRDRYVRFFYAHEAFAYLPESTRPQLAKLLSPPFEKGTKSPKVHPIYQSLYAQPKDQMILEARELLLFAVRNVVFLGGAGEIDVSYIDHEIADCLPILLRNLKRALFNYDLEVEAKADTTETHRLVAIHKARFEASLWYSSFITPKNFFEELVKPKVTERTPLWGYFVFSNIGKTGYSLPDKTKVSLMSLSLLGALAEAHEVNFGVQYRGARAPE